LCQFKISLNKMYKIYPLAILLFSAFSAFGQHGSIKGTVNTQDGQPAAYVNIILKEKGYGVTTGEDGTYVINGVKPGNYILVTSFIGLQTHEQEVTVKTGEVTVVNVTLAESALELEEVMITDTRGLNEFLPAIGKGKIKTMDLPQSVMVIDRAVLERQQTLRLSDVLMNTNGVYVMGTTGGTQEEIAGRGFAFGSSNTFKNGSRYNNGVMPEVSALEKVEVLKGSSAILFGQVAAGGILNLVTKKPKFEKGGEISFRTGSYDFYKPTLDVYGAVGDSKHLAYRFNTSYENSGSFRNNVNGERIYFNPSFLIKASPKTQVLIEADYLKDNRTLDYGTGSINYVVADIPRDRFLGATWSYYKAEQKSTTVSVSHQLNKNWEVRGSGSFQGFVNDLYGTTRPNAGNFVKSDGTWVRGIQHSSTDEAYYIGQVDLTGQINTGSITHTVLIGADIDKYDTKTPTYNNLTVYDSINIFDLSVYKQRTDIPTLSRRLDTKSLTNRAGAYVQDLISITESLKVLAGVRYSYLDRESNVHTFAAGSTAESWVVTNLYDDAFTPRFGLVYQPLKTISIFTSYANSFNVNTGKDKFNKPLKPSFLDQYEIGIKNEFFNGLLSANVTAYKIINSDFAQSVIIPQGNPENIPAGAQELAGEVTSKGLEVDIMTKPVNGFSVIAGYSYNDTRYTKSTAFINNSRLRYNPSHTANASVYYTFNNALKGLNVGIIGYYVGDRVAGRSTRTTVANDAFRLMPVPDYFQFDASAGYSFQNVSLRVKVSNLLNELSYNVHDDNSVNPIAPRMFSGTIAYKF
jgi:iron complex outermembrane receptor protein